jgi:hypothetical protein
LLFASCLLAIVGCKEDEKIEQFTVTNPDRQDIRLRAAAIERPGAVKHEDLVWFFLIKGPKDDVAKHVDEFNAFVRSVKFVEKKDEKGNKYEEAEWPEPKGWRKDPKGGMRYAAYRIDAKPKELEVTVTRLPGGESWLVQNVHRWQKQVNLPPAQSEKDLKEPEVTKEGEITWVDLKGLGVHTVSKPPEPMAAHGKKIQLPFEGKRKGPAPKADGGGKVPFKYTVPAGWEPGAANEIVVARYHIGKDVQLTLTPLAGGTLGGNVNRWRKEVGLPEVTEAAANESATTLKVADVKSYYVDIDNPNGPPAKNRLLGLIIPLDRTIWVVKMWGPSNTVGENKNGFETFVKSFKLEGR